MGLLAFLLFGFVIGLIARAIMPGNQSMGIVGTSLLGVVGSFVGGFLASLVQGGPILELRTSGIIGSILGALVVMFALGVVNRKR